jgi:acyl carrier protein
MQDHIEAAAATEIEGRLREIVVRSLRLSKQADEIKGLDLISELGVTSIDALEILINVEMEFGIEIPDEDLSARLVASLGHLARYIEKRRGAAA